MFNKDMLIQCRESQLKRQYIDPILLSNIINKKEEYNTEEVQGYQKQGRGTQLLVHWKECRNENDQSIV